MIRHPSFNDLLLIGSFASPSHSLNSKPSSSYAP